METVERFILKRIDGAYCNLKFETVKNMRSAARFNSMEEYNQFMTGYYRPDKPELYFPQPIKVTYEEVEHEREHGNL